jgi:hypothetical protein
MRKEVWGVFWNEDTNEVYRALHLEVAKVESAPQRLTAHLLETDLFVE